MRRARGDLHIFGRYVRMRNNQRHGRVARTLSRLRLLLIRCAQTGVGDLQ